MQANLCRSSVIALIGVVAGLLPSAPAHAQPVETTHLSAAIVTDYRMRGLSWSGGRATAILSADTPIASRTAIHGTLFAARGGERTGRSDMGFRLGARQGLTLGPLRGRAGASCRIFLPEDALSFCEVEAGASFDIASASLHADIAYVPRQSAIGGDNLYISTAADAAIPGTRLTLSAHVGHSSGSVRDPARAMRLRPVPDCWDYGVGGMIALGRASAGLRYYAASGRAVHQGGVVGEVRFDF